MTWRDEININVRYCAYLFFLFKKQCHGRSAWGSWLAPEPRRWRLPKQKAPRRSRPRSRTALWRWKKRWVILEKFFLTIGKDEYLKRKPIFKSLFSISCSCMQILQIDQRIIGRQKLEKKPANKCSGNEKNDTGLVWQRQGGTEASTSCVNNSLIVVKSLS